METTKRLGGEAVEEGIDLAERETVDAVDAETSERGAIIAPFGEFCAKELAARKVRRIMGIC